MKDDPVIKSIRETRHRISEECGHDPKKLIEYYMRMEKEYKVQQETRQQEENAEKDG